MRLKHSLDEAPKFLILAPDEERIAEIIDRFLIISRNKNLHIMGLDRNRDMEDEIQDLVLGVDIVVATPSRARAVYLKLGLNLNRIQTFVIDDAEEIVKQGMQTNVRELAQSCGKVQYLTFGSVENDKLHAMIDGFMPFATVIEVGKSDENKFETLELLAYQVPNQAVKIKLLNTIMRDDEVFDKVVVFVNSPLAAHDLLEQSDVRKGEAAILQPTIDGDLGFNNINDFKHSSECRILFIADGGQRKVNLKGIPFIFHYELPEDDDVFVQHVVKISDNNDAFSISLVTPAEMIRLEKIAGRLETEISNRPLPDDLIID
jgi:ATP-dependent RNA helicase RhlE